MVEGFWKNKKVFLTGHTGFKGSWAALWLLKAGAEVTGYSKDVPTHPSLFEELKLASDMNSVMADVRDFESLQSAVKKARPDIVIHMAAQPLVRYSYREPVETYMTNVMGTVHLFEAVRNCGGVRAIINVTSDKCYENQERAAGYEENEPMGGHDPYSNSKGCSELVTSAYRKSFFSREGVLLASGRAGNVIGGGDWAPDRLVPDIVRSVLNKETLVIRNPQATRPWQHVLEPVGGYLTLVKKLYEQGSVVAEGFNFGPKQTDHCSVENVILKMNQHWGGRIQYEIVRSEANPHEAHWLSLNCEKAQNKLNWSPRWNLDQALQKTVEWHEERAISVAKVKDISLRQIDQYQNSI